MEYNDKTLMTGDYLKILKFICSDMFQFRLVKILLSAVLLVHVCVTIITAYFMIYVLDWKEVFNYSTVLTAMFYPMCAIVVLLLKPELVNNIKREMPLWTIDSAGPNIYSKIKQEIRLLTTFAVIIAIAAVIASLLAVKLSHNDNVFFVARFSRDYFPFFQFIYKMTFPLTGYVTFVPVFQGIYYTQHPKYQLLMFRKYVSDISNNIESFSEKELFYKDEYQIEVRKRLVFCIERYKDFITLLDKKLGEMGLLIPTFGVAGCLLGVGGILFLVSGNITPEYYPVIAIISSSEVAALCAAFWTGQSLENEFEELVAAINEANWYNFNRTNKMIYLFFSMHLMKTRKIQFTENYSLNYKLGLAFVRGIYSVVSVLVNMRENH